VDGYAKVSKSRRDGTGRYEAVDFVTYPLIISPSTEEGASEVP
jgi:hypothetical protein